MIYRKCNEIPPICSLGCIRPPMNFCRHSIGWQWFTSAVRSFLTGKCYTSAER
jgi:hypothetical protein